MLLLSPKKVFQTELFRGKRMAQFQGSVRWFNNAKGYGFLGRDGGPDVFVHYTAIQSDGYKSLKEGELVEYDVVQGRQRSSGRRGDDDASKRIEELQFIAHEGRGQASPLLLSALIPNGERAACKGPERDGPERFVAARDYGSSAMIGDHNAAAQLLAACEGSSLHERLHG